jgi:hypothetical protein
MLKKAALAVFGLVLAGTMVSPPRAAAQVHIGVAIGSPEAYGTVMVHPAPVVVQPAPYVVYDEPYVVAHYWDSGYHEGYYYDRGTRYRDDHGHRHYDNGYRDGRYRYEHDHHDHEHHEHAHYDHEYHGHGHDD